MWFKVNFTFNDGNSNQKKTKTKSTKTLFLRKLHFSLNIRTGKKQPDIRTIDRIFGYLAQPYYTLTTFLFVATVVLLGAVWYGIG